MSSFGIEGAFGPVQGGNYADLLKNQALQTGRVQGPEGGDKVAPKIAGGSSGPQLDFGGTLADAIDRVDSLQADVANKTQALATGEPVALHDVMVSMGKSEVAFNLLLEVRNKLVDAWEKLSRSVV
ncbi:MAG: flagellar hook-basal body complex protein FliE [Planctomycetota bacterium]